jgi:hypothetical protein
MNVFIQNIAENEIVVEDTSAWRALGPALDLSRWLPLDPVEITGPHHAARMTNMRTEETIAVSAA